MCETKTSFKDFWNGEIENFEKFKLVKLVEMLGYLYMYSRRTSPSFLKKCVI